MRWLEEDGNEMSSCKYLSVYTILDRHDPMTDSTVDTTDLQFGECVTECFCAACQHGNNYNLFNYIYCSYGQPSRYPSSHVACCGGAALLWHMWRKYGLGRPVSQSAAAVPLKQAKYACPCRQRHVQNVIPFPFPTNVFFSFLVGLHAALSRRLYILPTPVFSTLDFCFNSSDTPPLLFIAHPTDRRLPLDCASLPQRLFPADAPNLCAGRRSLRTLTRTLPNRHSSHGFHDDVHPGPHVRVQVGPGAGPASPERFQGRRAAKNAAQRDAAR